MSKRDDINAALGALSLFTDAAANIHANNLQVEENRIDREYKAKQAEISRDFSANQSELGRTHELNKMEIAQQNTIELANQEYERDINLQYPGIDWVNGQPNFVDYDLTKSLDFTKANLISITDKLREYNIDTDGTDDQIMERHRLFNIGFNISKTAGASISDDISFARGGDLSKDFLTMGDVKDVRDYINNSLVEVDGRKSLGALGVQTLQGMGAIPSNMEILVDNNGLQYLSADNTELLQNMVTGLEYGALQNANFKNNQDYLNWENEQLQKGMEVAGYMANAPGVVGATTSFNAMALNYGGKLNYQLLPSGEGAITWGGQSVSATELLGNNEKLDQFAKKNPGFAGKRRKHVESVIITSMVSDASAMPVIMEQLRNMTEEERDQVLYDLAQIEGGKQNIAGSIYAGWKIWSGIQKVSDMTNKYFKEPVTFENMKGLKGDLDNFGVSGDIQILRNMELHGDTESDEYNAIASRYKANLTKLIGQYKQSGNDEILRELQEWIDLERATFDLSQSGNFGI
jgi:hypothetical protein